MGALTCPEKDTRIKSHIFAKYILHMLEYNNSNYSVYRHESYNHPDANDNVNKLDRQCYCTPRGMPAIPNITWTNNKFRTNMWAPSSTQLFVAFSHE